MAGIAKFAWVRQNGKIFPQKWPADGTSAASADAYKFKLIGTVVAEHALAYDEMFLSLDELAAKYPAPTHTREVLPPEEELPRQPKQVEQLQ